MLGLLMHLQYIPDAVDPEAAPTPDSVGVFLNGKVVTFLGALRTNTTPPLDPRVVAAIHAPTSKNWTSTFTPQNGYPFGGGTKGGTWTG
jgi:hypothetical protein